jgi:hypothetical protein
VQNTTRSWQSLRSLAWDNLVDNRGSLQNMSILDRVKDRAQDLSKCVSTTDKGKLDEYLTSVREVEKHVESMRKGKEEADDAAKAKKTPSPPPWKDPPTDCRRPSRDPTDGPYPELTERQRG